LGLAPELFYQWLADFMTRLPTNLRISKNNFGSKIKPVVAGNIDEDIIPWRTRPLWQAANATVNYLIDRHAHQIFAVKQTAQQIRYSLIAINDMLDALCRRTCAWCPEPCCLSADVRYDFKDLLFLHLTNQPIPQGQPKETRGRKCRYIGVKGCTLHRCSRPWICTWYLCPTQKKRLSKGNSDSLISLTTEIGKIQQLRKAMESAFIRINL
jgi:hypothetical protein